MILPDLGQRIAWYQERLRPEDPAQGAGISDWTITSEWADSLQVGDAEAWGCMCSPSALPEIKKLQPEDIAAKKAHIIVRTPKNAAELPEVERTLLHELGHVLVAPMASTNRDAEENAMHSIDHFVAQLGNDSAAPAMAREILLTAVGNPAMARAYRASPKEGDMPDPTDDKKEEKPDKPMAQEGGSPDATAIVEAVAKNDGNAALEILKKILASAANQTMPGAAPATEPPAPVPPTMGMKPEEAYARQMKAGIEHVIKLNPHLDAKQQAQLRKCTTIEDAASLAETYPRPKEPEKPADKATMGMKGHPAKGTGDQTPLARAMSSAAENPTLRKIMGVGTLDNDGVHFEPQAGVLVYIDGTEQINHQAAKYRAKRAEIRGAA